MLVAHGHEGWQLQVLLLLLLGGLLMEGDLAALLLLLLVCWRLVRVLLQ
jgi:hypothetical protein